MAEIPSSARGCRVRDGPGPARWSTQRRRARRPPDPPVKPDSRASPSRATAGAADPTPGCLWPVYRLAECLAGVRRRERGEPDELLDRDVAIKQIDQPHSHGLVEANLSAPCAIPTWPAYTTW